MDTLISMLERMKADGLAAIAMRGVAAILEQDRLAAAAGLSLVGTEFPTRTVR